MPNESFPNTTPIFLLPPRPDRKPFTMMSEHFSVSLGTERWEWGWELDHYIHSHAWEPWQPWVYETTNGPAPSWKSRTRHCSVRGCLFTETQMIWGDSDAD